MPRKDFHRVETELCDLEREFTQRLVAALKETIAGRNTVLFDTDEHNPYDFPVYRLSEQTRELMQVAHKSIELRKLLAFPTDPCAGKRFIDACEEHADLTNPHRLGPKRLAARLLSQIGSEQI